MIKVYSAICGNKDKPRTDIQCFSAYDRFRDPRLNAKIYKVLAHQFVDAEYSIWVDGNIQLKVAPEILVDMMGDADCAVFRHCERADVYEEAAFVIQKGKDRSDIICEQVAAYRRAGFVKRDLGMCGVLVRRNTDDVAIRNSLWWSEICRYSVRDQLSFPVVFDGAVRYFDTVPMNSNKFFVRAAHQR